MKIIIVTNQLISAQLNSKLDSRLKYGNYAHCFGTLKYLQSLMHAYIYIHTYVHTYIYIRTH